MEDDEVHDCMIVLSVAAAVVTVVVASVLWQTVRGWIAKAYLDRNVVKLAKSMAMAAAFYGSLLILLLGYRSQSLGLAAPMAAAWLVGGTYVSYVFIIRLEVLDRSASRD